MTPVETLHRNKYAGEGIKPFFILSRNTNRGKTVTSKYSLCFPDLGTASATSIGHFENDFSERCFHSVVPQRPHRAATPLLRIPELEISAIINIRGKYLGLVPVNIAQTKQASFKL